MLKNDNGQSGCRERVTRSRARRHILRLVAGLLTPITDHVEFRSRHVGNL